MDCDLAKLKRRLCEAEDALHELALGRAPTVVVDHNGERVEYNKQSIRNLRGYILELKDQIDRCQGGHGKGNQAFRFFGLSS